MGPSIELASRTEHCSVAMASAITSAVAFTVASANTSAVESTTASVVEVVACSAFDYARIAVRGP